MRSQVQKLTLYSKVFVFFVCGWIFLIPSNLFAKFGENQAYVHGLLVDYLLAKIYLSDFFSLALTGLCWWPILRQKQKIRSIVTTFFSSFFRSQPWQKVLVGGIIMLGIRQFFTPHPLAAVWFALHVVLVVLLGFGLQFQTKYLKNPVVFFTLVGTIFFQTLVASYQFWAQKALFGYWFLGEPDLLRGLGIATGVFSGAEKMVPYGTTAHPNILAGTMVIYTWGATLLFLRNSHSNWPMSTWLPKILIALSAICCLSLIFLTQSWTALAILVIGSSIVVTTAAPSLVTRSKGRWLATSLKSGLLIGIVATPFLIHQATVFFPKSTSFTRRDFLNQAAVTSWRSHLLWGVGLNQTTATIEKFSPSLEIVRFVQPIHHVGLLWLNETGILGVLILVVLWYGIETHKPVSDHQTHILLTLSFLLPILVLDHYVVTLNSGQLLIVLTLWLGSELSKVTYHSRSATQVSQ